MFWKKYLNFDQEEIIDLLDNKEIVAIATDTVYGLFGIIDPKVKKQINSLKRRDQNQSLQVFFADFQQLYKWIEPTEFQKIILELILPGNKSFLVELMEEKREILGEKNVLIRISDPKVTPKLSKLLKEVGPLYATSVNIHGEKELNTPKEIKQKLKIKNIVYGKVPKEKKPSTIVSLLNDKIEILRK